MFDRVNDLSGSLMGHSNGDGDVDAGPFADLLDDGEQPQFALASDSVEHVTEGRTTTVQPDGGHDAYLVVTDQRVLVVLGDQPDVVEIEFDFLDIAKCTYRSGFLNSKLIIGHDEEEINFSPTDGDVESVEEYVARVADVYRSVETAISTAEGMLDELETQIRDDGTEDDSRLRMQSQLSEARHQATHYDIVPSEKLLNRIEEARTEFDRRYVTAWLERGETDLGRAQSAMEDEEFETLCDALRTGARAVSVLEDELEDIDACPENADERVETLADGIADLAATYATATANAYETAMDAEEPETAGTASLEAYRRLAAADDAEWEHTDELPDIDVGADLEAIASMTVQALEAHATALESAGEDSEAEDTESARESYEAAAQRLETARDVASRHGGVHADGIDARLDELAEKIERTEWQWGGN